MRELANGACFCEETPLALLARLSAGEGGRSPVSEADRTNIYMSLIAAGAHPPK